MNKKLLVTRPTTEGIVRSSAQVKGENFIYLVGCYAENVWLANPFGDVNHYSYLTKVTFSAKS